MPNRTCAILSCGNSKIIARGLCPQHYQHMRSAGRLSEFKKPPRPRLPLEERFKKTGWTMAESGCWEWNGSKNRRGYGQINSGRRTAAGNPAPEITSRVAWAISHGPIPEGMAVCHHCDNPPCVNPDHLFLGTKADNNRDMAEKRRTLNGERRPQAKLTDVEVEEIRRAYDLGGISQRALGERYGVSASAVSLIVNRLRRKNPTYPKAT